MDDNTVSLLAALVGPCPECDDGKLEAAFDGEGTNSLCRSCGCCWHPELDWVIRVNPATCRGCTGRDVCTAARRAYGASQAPVVGADVARAR